MKRDKHFPKLLRSTIKLLTPLAPRGTIVEWEVVKKLPGNVWGHTWHDEACVWKIQLSERGTKQEMVATAVHEFAHVLVGDVVEPEGDHGPYWGMRYAQCYRAVYEERT